MEDIDYACLLTCPQKIAPGWAEKAHDPDSLTGLMAIF